MLWFALAASLSLPAPVNLRLPDVRAVFTVDDFPAYLQRAGASRIVYTRTTVRPDGTTQGCVAEVSSGDSKLDAYTCAIIVKRAKFTPATWSDGTPVYGVIRVPVSWMIENAPLSSEEMLKATTPDLELDVNHLPKGAHSIAATSLEIAADETGRPVSCAEWQPVKGDPVKRFPEFASIACQRAMTADPLTPPVDDAGKPVRSVQSYSVHFEVGH